MYLICKVHRDAVTHHDPFATVTPFAFANDAETAKQYAEEYGDAVVALDSSFRIALEDAIYQSNKKANAA